MDEARGTWSRCGGRPLEAELDKDFVESADPGCIPIVVYAELSTADSVSAKASPTCFPVEAAQQRRPVRG